MKVIAYPAVLDNSENENGEYTVTFPDVPGVISQGKNIPEAMANASEALGLMLYDAKKFPKVSDLKKVEEKNKNSFVTMIFSNLDEIAKTVKKPTVKKIQLFQET